MGGRRTSLAWLVLARLLFVGADASAQDRALVVQEIDPWGVPGLTTELTAQGISHDVVNAATFATTNLHQYTMVFVAACQPDALYTTWNTRTADLSAFVNVGGFVGIHGSVYFCGGASGAVFPQPPGGNVVWQYEQQFVGTVLAVGDPMVVGVPNNPTGNPLVNTTMSGLQPTDLQVVRAGTRSAMFKRQIGAGNVVVATVQYERGYVAGEASGTMMINEVSWGASVGSQCDGMPDSDGDGICDLADSCPGANDLVDTDLDSTPDGCDPCPLSDTDDSDTDGVCDDVDLCIGGDDNLDADNDNFPDPCDNCLGVANTFQEDADGDDVGDVCDVCPRDPDDDDDNDGVCGDVDICPGFDDALDGDGDRVPDACDNCAADANGDQVDSDFDGAGDACDACFGVGPPQDADGDGVPNSCDLCPLVADPGQSDGDGDGTGDLCDVCPLISDPDQFDWDGDGLGDACDVCPFGVNQQDGDGDGVADACDPCPLDTVDDTDGDGVCDSVDRCPGVDDGLDGDGDSIPDACDNCPQAYNLPQNDRDGDGFGSACDCDDFNPLALPGGVEVCDLADNDCNGATDDIDGEVDLWWPDRDGDGSGDPTGQPVEACDAPVGYTASFYDCDDGNPERHPDAIEWCDDIDNDCDTIVDGPRCTPRSAADCGCTTNGGGTPGAWVVTALVGLALRRRR